MKEIQTMYQTGKPSHCTAAMNIRIELKQNFPGVKFKVVSKSFSNGTSIGISWVDGPNTKEVEKVVNKYEYVNGYNDLQQEYGLAKYVHVTREFSDETIVKALQKIADKWANPGEVRPTLENYKTGNLYQFKYERNSETVRQLLHWELRG